MLKNALDWVVGSGELIDKPTALVNASGRATHAWASLADTLTVMSAHVIPEASITIPLEGRTAKLRGSQLVGVGRDPHLLRVWSYGANHAFGHKQAMRRHQLAPVRSAALR